MKLTVAFFLVNLLAYSQPEKNSMAPAGRSQHAAVYDAKNASMLIFGGTKHYKNIKPSLLQVDNTLWGWRNGQWKALSSTGPSLRDDPKMVYHEKNKKAYLYGGRAHDSTGKLVVLDEFWEWDGASWKLLTQTSTPGKILHTNLAYDSKRDRAVMFGGVVIGKGFSNAIWEWNGDAWQKIEALNAPSSRIAHSMMYSPALKKVLIVGGVNDKGEPQNEIWSWDGQTFELMDSHVPPIEPGHGNIACLDSGGKIEMLLFGRLASLADLTENDSSSTRGSTWIWDGKAWEKLALDSAPSLREGHTLVIDRKNEQAILFGGGGRLEAGYNNPNDIWVFKNKKWALKSAP